MENKNITEEVTIEPCKIGEIFIIQDETKSEDANGRVAFMLGEGLADELNKEENEDFKNRMITIVNLMHELLVDVQQRETEGE